MQKGGYDTRPFCQRSIVIWSFSVMKPDIHPAYTEITVTCSCGNSFQTRSTLGETLNVEVCSQCHPFYTGKQKMLDTAGRVDRFNKKYSMK